MSFEVIWSGMMKRFGYGRAELRVSLQACVTFPDS